MFSVSCSLLTVSNSLPPRNQTPSNFYVSLQLRHMLHLLSTERCVSRKPIIAYREKYSTDTSPAREIKWALMCKRPWNGAVPSLWKWPSCCIGVDQCMHINQRRQKETEKSLLSNNNIYWYNIKATNNDKPFQSYLSILAGWSGIDQFIKSMSLDIP